MSGTHDNLWAPWRMQYIRSLADECAESGCFLCCYAEHPEQDAQHLVVARGKTCFVVMNRFPYTNGHLMVAPLGHVGDLAAVAQEIWSDLNDLIRGCTLLLKKAVCAQGFNLGFNLGLCAGAGLPGHIHGHVVPRWNGDTNFMPVLGKTRVIPDALEALYPILVSEARSMGLGGP